MGYFGEIGENERKTRQNSYAAIYCAADVSRTGTGQRKMPQSRRGSGAADGARIGIMPRSSHVQPARVGSEARVSMTAWALLVSMIGFLSLGWLLVEAVLGEELLLLLELGEFRSPVLALTGVLGGKGRGLVLDGDGLDAGGS